MLGLVFTRLVPLSPSTRSFRARARAHARTTFHFKASPPVILTRVDLPWHPQWLFEHEHECPLRMVEGQPDRMTAPG